MGAFKLGKMTLRSLFAKPETLRYPYETKEPPAGLKGHIEIDVDTCILCGLCMRSCPPDALFVDRKARIWQIDHFRCVQCGYCVTVCPKQSLSMLPTYWAPSREKSVEEVAIPEPAPKEDAEA